MTTNKRAQLSVNVDHVATLREARQAPYPQPTEAAALAEQAGATGITVHLREDRRHIQDADVGRLREQISGKLNLEIAGTEAMLRIAERIGPDQVTLVPERPDEVTTEGGLDMRTQRRRIQRAATQLHRAGIEVSIFVDPEAEQISELMEMSDVVGFEINTDAYSRAEGDEQQHELEQIRTVSDLGAAAGLSVYAGHGLTVANVGAVAAIGPIEELNIGHSIVSRAVMVGMQAAVQEILAAITKG